MTQSFRDKMRFNGNLSAMEALKLKLAELNDRKNEKERVRGFSEGGSSIKVDEEEKDLAAQIAMIESEMAQLVEENEGVKSELDEVIGGMQESVAEQQLVQDDGSNGVQQMKEMADKFRAVGIECEVTINGAGKFEINVTTPGKFEGANLLGMSADKLQDVADEALQQKTAGGSKAKDSGDKKQAGPLDIMPGDADSPDSHKFANMVRARESNGHGNSSPQTL